MNIILFDGECHFCDASVQFIIKRDQKKLYKFASLQSDIGQKFLDEFQIPKTMDSLILIEGEKAYKKSTAALKIAKNFDGLWKLTYPLIIIPSLIRDAFYDIVAKNRHKLKKNHQCKIPTKEELDRFLH